MVEKMQTCCDPNSQELRSMVHERRFRIYLNSMHLVSCSPNKDVILSARQFLEGRAIENKPQNEPIVYRLLE